MTQLSTLLYMGVAGVDLISLNLENSELHSK